MERLKKFSWVILLLLLLLMFSIVLSYDNFVSRAVSDATGKPVSWITSNASRVSKVITGGLFLIAGIVVLPYLAVVGAVIGVCLIVVGLALVVGGMWDWMFPKQKPDNVRLGGAM